MACIDSLGLKCKSNVLTRNTRELTIVFWSGSEFEGELIVIRTALSPFPTVRKAMGRPSSG